MLTTLIALLAPGPALEAVPAPEPLPLVAPVPTPSIAQDDEEEEKPDKRDEIKELVKTLKGHAKKRGKEDSEAVRVIDTLMTEFEKSGPKDRKSIVKEIAGCLNQKRKQTDEGLFDNKLHIAAATALGRMGPESVKDLAKYAEHKNFEKDVTARRAIVLALGNTKSEDAIDTLIDLLTSYQFEIQAASAEALGQFKEIEQKERKEIFKKILDQATSVATSYQNDRTDPLIRKQHDTIIPPMLSTLQQLSGQEIRDPIEFRTWWNKNKKSDWDEGKDG